MMTEKDQELQAEIGATVHGMQGQRLSKAETITKHLFSRDQMWKPGGQTENIIHGVMHSNTDKQYL